MRLNHDLWARLLEVTDKQKVRFEWVKGHSGIRENERCDQLAMLAARGSGLPDDEHYLKTGGEVERIQITYESNLFEE